MVVDLDKFSFGQVGSEDHDYQVQIKSQQVYNTGHPGRTLLFWYDSFIAQGFST